jgi:hypothetical protein
MCQWVVLAETLGQQNCALAFARLSFDPTCLVTRLVLVPHSQHHQSQMKHLDGEPTTLFQSITHCRPVVPSIELHICW